MERHTSRLLGTLALVIIGGSVLAGCAGPSATAPTENPNETVDTELDAAWLDGGRMVGLVTQGSSTCVPTAEGEYADGVLQVTLTDDAEGVCTADFAPRVSLVAVPEDVDPSDDLAIEVSGAGYGGEITLPGVDGLAFESPSEQTPSAGWTTAVGTFIVLLWGSSGCPETITNAEITGDAAISVSLSGVPADKACTADVAPNAQITVVDGLVGVQDVALTVTSPGVEPFATTILGVDGATAD